MSSSTYAEVEDVKQRLDITNGDWDTSLEIVSEAASRWIDNYCGRRFWQNASDETRYFTPEFTDYLIVPDLLSVTTLKTDGNDDRTYNETWATTDYDLWPLNAAINEEPYNEIHVAPNGDYGFTPKQVRGVEIVGKFGYWSEIPAVIREACTLLTMRLWKRKDAIFGTAAVAALGVQVVQSNITADADIISLLDSIPRRLI